MLFIHSFILLLFLLFCEYSWRGRRKTQKRFIFFFFFPLLSPSSSSFFSPILPQNFLSFPFFWIMKKTESWEPWEQLSGGEANFLRTSILPADDIKEDTTTLGFVSQLKRGSPQLKAIVKSWITLLGKPGAHPQLLAKLGREFLILQESLGGLPLIEWEDFERAISSLLLRVKSESESEQGGDVEYLLYRHRSSPDARKDSAPNRRRCQ